MRLNPAVSTALVWCVTVFPALPAAATLALYRWLWAGSRGGADPWARPLEDVLSVCVPAMGLSGLLFIVPAFRPSRLQRGIWGLGVIAVVVMPEGLLNALL